jgi:hypothetical protein
MKKPTVPGNAEVFCLFEGNYLCRYFSWDCFGGFTIAEVLPDIAGLEY